MRSPCRPWWWVREVRGGDTDYTPSLSNSSSPSKTEHYSVPTCYRPPQSRVCRKGVLRRYVRLGPRTHPRDHSLSTPGGRPFPTNHDGRRPFIFRVNVEEVGSLLETCPTTSVFRSRRLPQMPRLYIFSRPSGLHSTPYPHTQGVTA